MLNDKKRKQATVNSLLLPRSREHLRSHQVASLQLAERQKESLPWSFPKAWLLAVLGKVVPWLGHVWKSRSHITPGLPRGTSPRWALRAWFCGFFTLPWLLWPLSWPRCPAQLCAGELVLPREPKCSLQRVSTGIKRLIQVSRQLSFFVSCS